MILQVGFVKQRKPAVHLYNGRVEQQCHSGIRCHMPAITTRSELTGRRIRMHRRLVWFSSPDRSSHAPCLADFTIITFGFRFSVQTGTPRRALPRVPAMMEPAEVFVVLVFRHEHMNPKFVGMWFTGGMVTAPWRSCVRWGFRRRASGVGRTTSSRPASPAWSRDVPSRPARSRSQTPSSSGSSRKP